MVGRPEEGEEKLHISVCVLVERVLLLPVGDFEPVGKGIEGESVNNELEMGWRVTHLFKQRERS